MFKKTIASSMAAGLLILLALAGVTVVVFVQGGTTGIAVHFFYLPIIFAAFYFGDYGAIVAALLAAALCGSWMPADRVWDPSTEIWAALPQNLSDVIVRALMFFVVGLVSSWTSTQLRRRIAEAYTLYEVAQNITSTLRIQRVLQLIADYAVRVMHAKACSIRLLDAKTGELELVAQNGLSEEYWKKGPVSLETSELDRQVLEGQHIQLFNVCSDPRFQYNEAAREAGLSSILCVPLETKQRIQGVVRIYSKHRRRFSQQEVDLLTAFANQAAVALENAGLYEDLRVSYYDTVRALTRAIEAKDMATYSHSERVADLADQLAKELGMDDEQRELLRFGAILHDVGKIGIAETSIEARSTNDAEYMFYKMHPLIGQAILAPVHFLGPVLSAVTHHHENWDGSGFPEGTAGKDIPLEGRIMAICDAFDRAMHPESGLVLRRTPQEALNEIISNAGTRFDPDLARSFRRARMRGTPLPESASESRPAPSA